jgi:hypothetical protein
MRAEPSARRTDATSRVQHVHPARPRPLPGTPVAGRKSMLRITAEKRGALCVLKLEGRLQGEWVGELRRSWRAARDLAPPLRIRVELADVQFMDAAGRALLEEMHREGVDITGRGVLARAICEEIATGPAAARNGPRRA